MNTLAACVVKHAECAKDCANQGNADLADCISPCSDCAPLGRACIPLLARGSEFSAAMCGTCPDACERCAQERGRAGMLECAEASRAAAEAYRQVTGAAA